MMTVTMSDVRQDVNDIEQLISQKLLVSKRSVLAFTDRVEFLTDLLKSKEGLLGEFISLGHVTPEIALAADRVGLSVTERIGQNPFSLSGQLLQETPIASNAILYIANPNRITGGSLSIQHLREAAELIPHGLLIIDEYYFDYFGISALPLVDLFTNITVLRSFTSAFGVYSSDAGYAVSSERLLEPLRASHSCQSISRYLRRSILAGMSSDDALVYRMKEIHDESLRLARELTALGVMCRITATDALLFRVKSPKDVGNELSRNKIQVENLDGYPQLKGYLSYRIESTQSNEKLLNAFKRMPKEHYRIGMSKQPAQTLRRPADTVKNEPPEVPVKEQSFPDRKRSDSTVKQPNKHLFKLG